MTRFFALILIAAAAPALGGCVAGMAISAASMAAEAAAGHPAGNAQLQPEAREACSARAEQYGAVHVIDVQQASAARIIVWGTVDDGRQKRSFQCNFGTTITGFTLRAINPRG
jgi:hypothetical protein